MIKAANDSVGGRTALDLATGLAVFVVLTVLMAGTNTFAATLSEMDASAFGQSPSSAHPVLVLGAVFSALFALNAAFFRHLRRTYLGSARPIVNGK